MPQNVLCKLSRPDPSVNQREDDFLVRSGSS